MMRSSMLKEGKYNPYLKTQKYHFIYVTKNIYTGDNIKY